jgi:hypothetical protein
MQITADKLMLDESIPAMPRNMQFVKLDMNRQLLHAAWKAAGLQPRYPLSTNDTFALLRLCGYRIDRPSLDYILAKGKISAPDKDKNDRRAYLWTEYDIASLADTLYKMRRFEPLHPSHQHRATADELIKAKQEAVAKAAAMQSFSEMSVPDLIRLMAESEKKETREMLATVIKMKLGYIHLKGNEDPTPDPSETN